MNKTTTWIIWGILGVAGLATGVSSLLLNNSSSQLGFVTQSDLDDLLAESTGLTFGCAAAWSGVGKECVAMENGPFTEPTCNNSCNTPLKKYKGCTDYQCAWSDTNSDGKICDSAPLGAECKKPNDPPHGKYKVCTNYQCAWSDTNTDWKTCDSAPVGAECKPSNGTGNNWSGWKK